MWLKNQRIGTRLWTKFCGHVEPHPRKQPTQTPFRLTFGHDAVLPAEICLQSTSIQRQHDIPSNQYWNMILDEITDLDEERMMALNTLLHQKERVARSYNKKVKQKAFSINELV